MTNDEFEAWLDEAKERNGGCEFENGQFENGARAAWAKAQETFGAKSVHFWIKEAHKNKEQADKLVDHLDLAIQGLLGANVDVKYLVNRIKEYRGEN